MLEVYCGGDVSSARAAAVAAASSKDPQFIRIEAEMFVSGVVRDAVGAVSLFGGDPVYLLDTPSSNIEFQEEIDSLLSAMGESSQYFFIVEKKILAPQKKKYQKYAKNFDEFTAVADTAFKIFALADALSSKDKKNLWILIQKAKKEGISNEEIIGTLWWQLKTMMLAARTKSAEEAGVNKFPYDKAKRALASFPPGEIDKMSLELLNIYHQGHAGEVDLGHALEQWVLGM